ncbi:hypothetical protein CNBB3710 [Cryptococcus deneoformans B-3501A]|uniref:hypothetical protein n=1 Tax=Cryptococcus deneoformans (strain B-3501A) TaxID=283643 RepID=UPI000042E782|nr:hypothetical protein CNBB3710 [Cryptococcus neoformans var. neoformans B-3501A]EAL22493.1 hypothetical protein CNBB3710 [Cryptococcus neoformans var. neoformans B-3501A]
MPKTTNPKAKPSLAKPKLQTKAKKSRQSSSSSADMSLLPLSPKCDASLDLTKDLVLQIVLAKLQSSKTCDWYALSQKLNKDEKRGWEKKKGEITGTELHDLYHNRILPALKSGIALWSDGNNERRHVSASSSGSDKWKGEHRVEAQENVCQKWKKQDG